MSWCLAVYLALMADPTCVDKSLSGLTWVTILSFSSTENMAAFSGSLSISRP